MCAPLGLMWFWNHEITGHLLGLGIVSMQGNGRELHSSLIIYLTKVTICEPRIPLVWCPPEDVWHEGRSLPHFVWSPELSVTILSWGSSVQGWWDHPPQPPGGGWGCSGTEDRCGWPPVSLLQVVLPRHPPKCNRRMVGCLLPQIGFGQASGPLDSGLRPTCLALDECS